MVPNNGYSGSNSRQMEGLGLAGYAGVYAQGFWGVCKGLGFGRLVLFRGVGFGL